MRNKKRVGFVIHHIEYKGGEERMCALIANYLVTQGYDVTIVSLWTEKETNIFYSLHPDICIRFVMDTKMIVRLNHWLPWFNFYQKRLRNTIKNSNIDVLIDVDTMCTPDTTKALQGLMIKHIAWDHYCYANFEKKYLSRLPFLRNNIDKLVVLTKDDLRDYVKKAEMEPSKVVQIYNPSPIEIETYTSHSNKRVLAMGRLEEQKRFDRLLNIWSMVEKDCPEWELEIVGSGSLEKNLKSQAEKLNLQRVIFSTSTSNPIEKYKDASIFVLTSQFEGFALVLLEALFVSLPVVSFDCDNGPREIIQEGINGFLIEQNNEVLFKNKLLELMNDDEKRETISRRCLDSVRHFNLESIGKEWQLLIDLV